jgi:hypothetical protein
MKIIIDAAFFSNNKKRDKFIAVHEAGHAVVAISLGYDICSISTNYGNSKSSTRCGLMISDVIDNKLHKAVMACGGVTAVDMYNIIDEYGNNPISDGDFALIQQAGFNKKHIRKLCKKAHCELIKHEHLIKMITSALLKKKRLNRREVQSIIKKYNTEKNI